MCKLVIELQKDIIENRLDVISILRKAKLVANKLSFYDFNEWINRELNGYENYEDIPEYRTVIGEFKAENPYYGLIPLMMPSSIAKQMNSRKLFNPISELISLSKSNQTISMGLPIEVSEALCANEGVHFPCFFIIPVNALLGIIESVKNHLLEWCFKLENDGIVGDDFEFSDSEKEKAKTISQQINYYGPVVTGNVNNSQLVSGNDNSNNLNNNDIAQLLEELKKSIKSEQITDAQKADAIDILNDINDSIKANKKKSVIKSALIGLKDFLINVGASVSAAIITSKMNGF